MMTRRVVGFGLCVLFVLAMFSAGAGCGSNKGYKKTTGATTSLDSFASELEAGGRQLQTTMTALNELASATGDLRRPYDRFVSEIKNLERAAERARKARTDFEKSRKAFLAEWEARLQTISSEDLQETSKQRRDRAIQQFEKLDATFNSVRESYDPLIALLQDISTLLAVDLNRESLTASQKAVTAANSEAGILRDRIGVAMREVRAFSDRLSPVTPAEQQ